MKSIFFLALTTCFLIAGCDSSSVTEVETPVTVASEQKNDCGCQEIEATLFTTADFETFTAGGTIVGDLNGTIAFTGDANSLSQISSETFPPVNPSTFSFTSKVDYVTERGTITTRGVGVAGLGPSGEGTEMHTIISGTERFENATGTFFLRVKADETGGNFVEQLTGQLCVVRPACD